MAAAVGVCMAARCGRRERRRAAGFSASAHDADGAPDGGAKNAAAGGARRLELPRGDAPPPTPSAAAAAPRPPAEERSVLSEEDEVARDEGNAIEDLLDVRPPRAAEKLSRTQVVMDIDDTVKSSGGVRALGQYLGGVDTQYRRGQFYPGVFQFALELAVSGLPAGVQPAPVAVLTARARELKFALALEPDHPVCRKFRYAGMERGYHDWGVGPVLYGSVKEWVLNTRKARRKLRNFQLLHVHNRERLDSEHCRTQYVYIGDTGELDLAAGRLMLERYPQEMRAVFLHTVYNDRMRRRWAEDGGEEELLRCGGDGGGEPCWEDTRVGGDGGSGAPIVYFRTYVGAARKACEHDLIDERALRRVAAKAVLELRRLDADHASSRWADLMADIKEARIVVGGHWLWP